MASESEFEFELKIDFVKGEGDPGRVFRVMSELIESLQSLDSHLAASFDVALGASLVLQEVESGSIKARLRNLIQGVPDEAIKDGEWKKVFGYFLLKSKYVLLEWLSEKEEINSRGEVRQLEHRLVALAEETELKQLPAYSAPKAEVLLSDIQSIQSSLASLEKRDIATYKYHEQEIGFNRDLGISDEIVREVLTKEVVDSTAKRIVKVKKPDYLGQSMWGLQYDGRSIDAKINDLDWLFRFQHRTEDIKPGDSLRVLLREKIYHGYDGEIVHRHYEVENVYDIIKPPRQDRMKI